MTAAAAPNPGGGPRDHLRPRARLTVVRCPTVRPHRRVPRPRSIPPPGRHRRPAAAARRRREGHRRQVARQRQGQNRPRRHEPPAPRRRRRRPGQSARHLPHQRRRARRPDRTPHRRPAHPARRHPARLMVRRPGDPDHHRSAVHAPVAKASAHADRGPRALRRAHRPGPAAASSLCRCRAGARRPPAGCCAPAPCAARRRSSRTAGPTRSLQRPRIRPPRQPPCRRHDRVPALTAGRANQPQRPPAQRRADAVADAAARARAPPWRDSPQGA